MKGFQALINDIVDRLYWRDSQLAYRVILKRYYGQSPDRRRSVTLDDLGKSEGLKKVLTRERARQILSKFRNQDLPNELKLLERGEELDDSLMREKRRDLLELRNTVSAIVNEVETFTFPIFAWRVQNRLKSNGFISSEVFFPLVTDLASVFKLPCSFKVESYKGKRLVLNNEHKLSLVTSDIVSYAAKVATHLGGTCSFDALLGPSIYKNKPEFFNLLPNEFAKKYLLDLFSYNNDFMPLQSEGYYAFRDRDERVSKILAEIFCFYDVPIGKDELISVVIGSLKHRFMTAAKSEIRERKIETLENSGDALDEYCRRTALLDESDGDKRKPGIMLKPLISKENISAIVQSQSLMLEKIREAGKPLSSNEFAYFSRALMPDSHRTYCITAPVLYKKEGSRLKYEYKPLADDYSGGIEGLKETKSVFKNLIKDSDFREIKKELDDFALEGSDDVVTISTRRREQYKLRSFLIKLSDSILLGSNKRACKCLICNRYFPTDLLIAAHVKKRSDCSAEERRDFENIAMLQCGGCERLFENGYIVIDDQGNIVRNDNYDVSEDVLRKISRVSGNKTEFFILGNEARARYAKAHREKFMSP